MKYLKVFGLIVLGIICFNIGQALADWFITNFHVSVVIVIAVMIAGVFTFIVTKELDN